jgi:hypothetical protein
VSEHGAQRLEDLFHADEWSSRGAASSSAAETQFALHPWW